MLKVMVSAICVLAAAMPLASNASAAEIKASDIAGRWQGETYAQEKGGNLTLDIVACGAAGAASAWPRTIRARAPR